MCGSWNTPGATATPPVRSCTRSAAVRTP
ncbi:hypothetical protein E2C01_055534 [Portunus trituberculatus]|uniref:Uncharacterized protein n=1 Tax=Portunus trituberculatus TaxID=210409 RepID=A0A5B7GRG9_PORTR|nr:hypothetical protein [Portunus trituberculatus]